MARIPSPWLNGLVALTAGSTFYGAQQAAADVRVIKSDEPTIKKGDVLKDEAIFAVPAGKTVKVLLPGNVTKVLTGPYTGAAKDFQPSLTQAKPKWQYPTGATLGSPPPRPNRPYGR